MTGVQTCALPISDAFDSLILFSLDDVLTGGKGCKLPSFFLDDSVISTGPEFESFRVPVEPDFSGEELQPTRPSKRIDKQIFTVRPT